MAKSRPREEKEASMTEKPTSKLTCAKCGILVEEQCKKAPFAIVPNQETHVLCGACHVDPVAEKMFGPSVSTITITQKKNCNCRREGS